MDFLNKWTAWLEGNRTYLIVLVAAVVAGLQAFGIAIPDYVLTALAGLGLYTLRAAVSKA